MNIYLRCTLLLAVSLAVWVATLMGRMPVRVVPAASAAASGSDLVSDINALPPTAAGNLHQRVALSCAPHCEDAPANTRH